MKALFEGSDLVSVRIRFRFIWLGWVRHLRWNESKHAHELLLDFFTLNTEKTRWTTTLKALRGNFILLLCSDQRYTDSHRTSVEGLVVRFPVATS